MAHGHLANHVSGGRKQPFGLHAKKCHIWLTKMTPPSTVNAFFFPKEKQEAICLLLKFWQIVR